MSRPFKLKYKNSAFPFKSPLQHEGTESSPHPNHHMRPTTTRVPDTAEGWDVELKKTNKEKGHKAFQDKLWEYEAWRKLTKEGQNVYDTSNKPDEYTAKPPSK